MDEKSEYVVIVVVESVSAKPKLGFRAWVIMMNWEIDNLRHLFIEIGLHWGGSCGIGDLGRENFLILTMGNDGKGL